MEGKEVSSEIDSYFQHFKHGECATNKEIPERVISSASVDRNRQEKGHETRARNRETERKER